MRRDLHWAAWSRPAACMVAGLLLSGCTRSTADLEVWVVEKRAQPAPPLEPLPPLRTFPAYEYKPAGLRDPFSTPTNSQDGTGPRPDPNRRKEALEAFPLDAMDMVGTMGSGAGLVGLVMAPDKVTYRVRLGNYMGQNDGRVVEVSEDSIKLVELVSDGAGGWLEREASIALEDN